MTMGNPSIIAGEVKVIEDFIHLKDLVFDIGACTGEWSSEVLKRFPDVVIHQFEPALNSFEQLYENYTYLVKIGQIIQNNCAVSNVEKSVPFYYCSNWPVLSTMYRRNEKVERDFGLDIKTVEVPSTTLDTYCKLKNIQHIHFLKIDTEGCEYNVLRGSENLLKNSAIDYIQFEYGGCFIDSNVTLKEVFNYLTSLNYKLFSISSSGVSEIAKFTPKLENYVHSNFLAIRRT